MMRASQQYVKDAAGVDTDILVQVWFESDPYEWHRFNFKYGSVGGRVLTEADHKTCARILVEMMTADVEHLGDLAGPEL